MLTREFPAGSGLVAHVATTMRADGDFDVKRDDADLVEIRHAVMPGAWTWLRQIHSSRVVEVGSPGEMAGFSADAVVTASVGCVVAVHTADCMPVVMVGDGTLGVVHAGWRGVVEGVIPAAVAAMRQLGGPPHTAMLGPCIRPASYEFGENELALVAATAGDSVRSRTTNGKLALDLAEAARSVLSEEGVDDFTDFLLDTADSEYFSHRVRGDTGRQATVARLEMAP